jgi:hypothetical protein
MAQPSPSANSLYCRGLNAAHRELCCRSAKPTTQAKKFVKLYLKSLFHYNLKLKSKQWLTEKQIATVFERDRTVIGRHIKKIIKTGELIEFAMCIFCTLQILINQSLILALI